MSGLFPVSHVWLAGRLHLCQVGQLGWARLILTSELFISPMSGLLVVGRVWSTSGRLPCTRCACMTSELFILLGLWVMDSGRNRVYSILCLKENFMVGECEILWITTVFPYMIFIHYDLHQSYCLINFNCFWVSEWFHVEILSFL